MSSDASAFASLTGADLIIRSSDDVDFPVHKAIIGLASPIFRDMFDIPLPPSSKDTTSDAFHNGLPLVQVTEGQEILLYLLSYCYAGILKDGIREWTELGMAVDILHAARKYEMHAINHHMSERLIHAAYVTPDKFAQIFAIASLFELEDAAKHAMKITMRFEVRSIWQSTVGADVRYLSAGAFVTLAHHHEACVAAASSVMHNLRWIGEEIQGPIVNWQSSPMEYCWFSCEVRECKAAHVEVELSRYTFTQRAWWRQYMDSVIGQLARIPLPSVIGETQTIAEAISQATKCGHCGPRAYKDLAEFNEILKKRIEKVLAEVSEAFQCLLSNNLNHFFAGALQREILNFEQEASSLKCGRSLQTFSVRIFP